MRTDGIRIIFQDVDGCLNPADGELFSVIPGEALSAHQADMLGDINRALDASPVEHFILNTGRPFRMVQTLLDHLPTSKARYVLLEHACVLYDRQEGRYLDCARLAEHCGLSDLASRYSRVGSIQRLIDWYHQHGQAKLEAKYQAKLPALDKVGNLSFVIPDSVDGDELLQSVRQLARADLPPEELRHHQFLRSDRYIDILPGIHKLDGIHLLTAHLGADLDHALAVGDFLNDLPVFEEFHRVLCPANAHPTIKALAKTKGDFGHVSVKPYGNALLELFDSMEL